ncbi:hypothetical protein NPS01_07610 [Nocardioides psychrotolerans]|uniref:Barstar (Barnase inhibitor) n=1 Tax=Nocardioides psychrotolerans TaxID=1005945 RepID=A0A1I3D9I8_9ACTN|nr:barstar family protein [Nocardioides psychrotolerans]GEP37098.1 hypothetical protein NPS01_07610 [Nocardioides psychrotolerans]SFH83414.1 Barstar (barnase inhibitor) [Nocardioides psychrotolerans]
MSGLEALLDGLLAPGVHRLHPSYDVGGLRPVVEHAGWRWAHLDGWTRETKGEVLHGLGEVLGFPEHYGRNLDALADCLDDICDATVLVWEGWGAFAVTDEPTFAVVVEILRRRTGRKGAAAFSVLLTGAGLDLALPELD